MNFNNFLSAGSFQKIHFGPFSLIQKKPVLSLFYFSFVLGQVISLHEDSETIILLSAEQVRWNFIQGRIHLFIVISWSVFLIWTGVFEQVDVQWGETI